MSRTSLVHYIAPSAISITPNANGSENDLAVYVARGAKIKVLAPKVGIGYSESTFQQWNFAGRNRRLSNPTLPYTIYARLAKSDQKNGYLVFAPKQQVGSEWVDKYAYVTRDGLIRPANSSESSEYWYIRLGDVSLPADAKRTVTLDTGVLGTDQYNTEWIENADALPLRVELGCTIDDEDAGQTPYVPWDKSLLLNALLMKGWEGVSNDRFRHWTISRNTGNSEVDAAWPTAIRQAAFMNTGTFSLNHSRGSDDDFGGVMSAVFTITAWGTKEGSNTEYEALASASITVLAESVEKYELALSSSVVSYSPQTDEYNPKQGVKVRIRAVDQRGDVSEISLAQLKRERLVVSFSSVDSDVWTPIVFSGVDNEVAEATIGMAAFLDKRSLNVQLTRPVGYLGTEAVAELARTTIAFVRDGEDSREREWVFMRSKTAVVFGEDATSGHLLPALIAGGEVNPKGIATGNDKNKNQEGWVPQGWLDEQQGVDSDWCYEYGAFRDFNRTETNSPGAWGDFSTPRIWNHFGTDGGKPVSRYQWSKNVHEPPQYTANNQDPGTEWKVDVPNRPEGSGWYLWTISAIKNADGTFGPWGDPIRMTGDEGAPGTKVQRAYFKSDSDVAPQKPVGEVTSDLDSPGAWRRIALSADEDNRYVYICERVSEDNGETWKAWGNVVLFCYRPSRSQIEEMILTKGSELFVSKKEDDDVYGKINFHNVITHALVSKHKKGLAIGEEKDGLGIDEAGNAILRSLMLASRYGISEDGIGKLAELMVNDLYGIATNGVAKLSGLNSADFRPGTAQGLDGEGFGITRDALGKYTLELDNIIARGRMILAELEVHCMSYIGGEVVLSPCGNRIDAVEARNEAGAVIDVNASDDGFLFALAGRTLAVNSGALSTRVGGPAACYRCYFLATDGEEAVRNEWSVGQLARSRTNNIANPGTYTDYRNRDYWRIVVGVSRQPVEIGGKKYHYIDLSNAAPDTDVSITDSDGVTHVYPYGGHGVGYDSTPQAGDSVVGMGHAWDGRRWNVAVLSAINIGWVCYNGIDRFDLAEERIVNEFSTRRVRVASDRFELVPYADPTATAAALTDRGAYSPTACYGRSDFVTHLGEMWKSSVAAGETVTGEAPSVASPHWERYVAKGADGVDGKAYGVRFYANGVPMSTLPVDMLDGAVFEARTLLNGQPYRTVRIVLGLYDSAGRQLGDLVDVQTPSDGIPDFGSLFVPADCSVIRCTYFDADGVTVLCEDSVSIVRNGMNGEKGEKGDKGDDGAPGQNGADGQPAVSYDLVRKGETAVTLAVSGTGGDAAFRLSGKFTYGVIKTVGGNDPVAVTAPLTGKYTPEGAERSLTYDADTRLLTGTYTGTQAYTAANAGDIPASVLVTVTFTDNGNTVTLTDTVPVTVGGGVVIAIDNKMGSIRQDVANAQGNISTLLQTAEGLSSKVASIAGGGNLLWDAGFTKIVGENTPATRTGVRDFMGRTSSAWVGGTLDGQNCFNVHNKGLASNAYSGITWRVPFSMAGRFTASVQSRVTGVSGGEETQGNIEFVAHAADGTRLKTFFAASAVNRSTAVQGAFRQLWVTGDVAGTYAVGGTVYKVAYIAVNVWLLCNGTIRFAKPQFERGEAPTEWGLSPMDSVHSEIEQSREAVRLGVSDDMRRTGIDITRGLIRIMGEKTRVEGNLDVSEGQVTLRDAEGIDRVRLTSRPVGALDAQTVVATRRFAVVREVAAGAQLRFDMLDGALLALEKDAQLWGCGSINEIYENTGDYNDYSIEITTYERQADGSLLPTADSAPWNAIIPQGYSYRVSLVNDSGVSSQISTTDFANGNTPNSSVAYIDPGKVIKAAQKGGYRLYLDVMTSAETGAEIGASGSAKTYVVRAELILKAVTASKTIVGNDGIYTAHGKNHYLYYGQDGFLAGVERSDLTEGISSTGALRPKKDAYPEVYHYAKNDRLWTKNRATGAAHIAEFAVSDNGQVAYRPHWTNSQGAANYQQTDGAERDTGNVCIVAASTDVVIYDSAVAVRGSQDSSSPILDISRAEYDGHVLELYLIDTANQGTDGYNTVYIGRESHMVDLLGKMNAQGNAGHVLSGSTQNTPGLTAVQIERRFRKMRMLFVKEYRTVSEVYNNVWLITGVE